MKGLPRRLFTLEAKARQLGENVCLFLMPGEDAAAAMIRTFGPTGAPLGAKVTILTWLPVQGVPE